MIMVWNVWAQLPQLVNGKRPWSRVATEVTDEQAQVYRDTFHFPIHIEMAADPDPSPAN